MLVIVFVGAVASAIELISILYQFSPKVLKTVLGYAVWAEMSVSIGLTLLAITSGTASMMLISTVTALLFAFTMYITKALVGYRKYVKNPITGKREWVEYEASITAETFGGKVKELSMKLVNIGKRVVDGFLGTGSVSNA